MTERIKLTFLGTGSAIPTARRNHPAMLLQYAEENILIDCGEGTQRQFRKAKLNPCKITKILITHWHGDHVLGLPGLLMTMMMNGYGKDLEIYGPKGTSRNFKQYFDLIGAKGQVANIKVKEIGEGVFFDKGGISLEALEMNHDAPALGYSFVVKEKKRLDRDKLAKMKIPNSPLVGELAQGKIVEINGKKVDGKKMLYVEPQRKVSFVMDTRKCDNAVKIAKDSDLFVCESTHSVEEQEIAEEHGHLTSVDAAGIAKKAKVKNLVLTHLSQRYDCVPKTILKEAKEVFDNTIVVEDLDCVEL